MSDRHRPHQFPMAARGEEVISWQCGACGEWVNEFGPSERTNCPVNWRKRSLPTRLWAALQEVLDA